MTSNTKTQTLKDRSIDWAIDVAQYGSSWWLPLVLLVVCTVNSMTGGVFIWCFGVVQSMLFSVVVMSNKKLGVLLGPLILTIGSAVAAVTYIQLMQTSGADDLLIKTGAKDSKWLEKASEWAASYGVWGLLALQVAPVPIPTAVIVVAGMLAKMDEVKIFVVIISSKFIQLLLAAVGLRVVSEGQTVEEYLRQQFKPGSESGTTEKKEK
jgi:membrane protein YqaA with SNARE-associated domain